MNDTSAILGQLAEEFTARVRGGELPQVEDYAARHPELAERIRALFPTLLLLEGLAGDAETSRSAELVAGGTFGAYRIEGEIGRGAMGVVYEAVHLTLNRRVALKVLPIQGPEQASRLERFLREAQTAAGLHHTNIVPVFDVGQVNGVPYYAMQLISGRSLDKFQRQAGDFATIARLGVQAAEGLAYAHQRGVIHRDIKPSNLLLDEQGVLWITDFGLARRAQDLKLTQSGALVGTPHYMAPEQAEATRRPVDHRADIYSLGATLYELLTGQAPFAGDNLIDVLVRIVDREPVPPSRLDPKVPRDLETVVLKAMAKRPEERYQTAQDLADDLRRFLNLEPVRARRITVVDRAVRWCRRNPVVAGLAATVALVVLVAATVATGLLVHADAQQRRANERDAAAATEAALRQEAERDRVAAETAQARAEEAEQKNARFFMNSQLARVSAIYESDPPQAIALLYDVNACPIALRETAWRYYERACRRWELATLQGHTASVTSVAYSPDGQTLASGSWDDTVRLWDVNTGQPKATFKGHTDTVMSVAFSPDGQTLASGSRDETVRLWDVNTRQPKATLPGPFNVRSLAFSPDGQRVFVWDFLGHVRAWTVKDGQPTDAVNPPLRPAGSQAVSPDGSSRAEARYSDVVLIEPANYDPQREYAERLVLEATNRIPWHQQQAALAEKDAEWFAAAFHLNQLLKDKPDDADLFRRRDQALEKLKPPGPMERLTRPAEESQR